MFRHLLELIIRGQLIHHKDYDLVQPVIDHIRKDPGSSISLHDAAKMMGRSPSSVSRIFKKITGRSFKQYQVWFRLERASEMLKSMPNRPIVEIAQECGFSDPLYFSRAFRKYYGDSPTDHRCRKKGVLQEG
jgi:AraC-like DNA-binding protein